jgi:hypothetical protein
MLWLENLDTAEIFQDIARPEERVTFRHGRKAQKPKGFFTCQKITQGGRAKRVARGVR